MSLKVQVAKENIEKYEFIANLINEKSDDYFKVILVSNGTKALACQEWLKKTNGIESNVISENLSSEEAIIIVQNWYILGNQAPVMIISDKAPFDSPLDLSHLDLVIHYDYPDSKLHFADRFLHLKKCVTSIYDETKSGEKIENCYLLAGPEDCDKIKTIRTLLLRTKSFIPNDLNKVNQTVQSKRSLEIMHQPLCQNLKIQGVCEKRCKKRHFIVPKTDVFASFQNTDAVGIIEFNVCQVFQANHYLVKIVRIKNEQNQIIFDANKVLIKLLKLQNKTYEPLKKTASLGEIVLVKDSEDQCWKRCQILYSDSERVQILFIDEGTTTWYNPTRLDMFKLPEAFHEAQLPRVTGQFFSDPFFLSLLECNLTPTCTFLNHFF